MWLGIAGKHFQVGAGRTARYEVVLLIRLSRVFAFACLDHVHLAPTCVKGAHMPLHAEKQKLCDVAEVETDPSTVWPAILATLGPDDVRHVAEPPCLHDLDAFGQQGIGHPEIQVGVFRRYVVNWQGFDLIQRHSPIASQTLMLGSYLSRSILETPWRIGQNRLEATRRGGEWCVQFFSHPNRITQIDL